MPPKKLRLDINHQVVDLFTPVKKSKPKEVVEPEWLTKYRLDRDRVIYRTSDQNTKDEILKIRGL